MDMMRVRQIADDFVAAYQDELKEMSLAIIESAEQAQERIETFGLPEDSFFSLWDPQKMYRASKMMVSLQTEQLFTLLKELDPDEGAEVRKLIVSKLHGIEDSFFDS